jgi:hypothetical protein
LGQLTARQHVNTTRLTGGIGVELR